MISKELFIEVLGLHEYDEWEVAGHGLREYDNSVYWYFFKPSKSDPTGETGCHTPKAVNIHELAHRCKEWAYEKGYYIRTGYSIIYKEAYVETIGNLIEREDENIAEMMYSHGGKTEPEVIFAAAQWILDQKATP